MSNQSKIILNSTQLDLTIKRLSFEIIENCKDFSDTVIIGLQPRGILLSQIIHGILEFNLKEEIKFGYLDTTFFRDDFRRKSDVILPSKTTIEFSLEAKKVILIDDVLFTGRSIRSALDALVSFGRPSSVDLLVLIDRRFSRELPIQPKYIGKSVDVIDNEYVVVDLGKKNNNVLLLNEKK
ncbi:MAG: bifunctional pyr operon transcriptional regulator/uracil phosphoribosyltransferase [Flavobacteriales bacterium]|jgi:pyrimidine operon attenuation protein/uracil phosphoribosyltransferase|nr:bifunctional pyr operon transcriptional regulator/uracil phosphoribosyltransferase [Flavobacteriales bacterium]|tara:strand:+ start:1993 stop:2535 length:543 start_codon:yes stop_codon:yes gene_type:complete